MCGRSRYFLPPAVALRLAITIIFNDSFFFLYNYNLGIGGSGKRGKAELMECLGMPVVRAAIYFAQRAEDICSLPENVSGWITLTLPINHEIRHLSMSQNIYIKNVSLKIFIIYFIL